MVCGIELSVMRGLLNAAKLAGALFFIMFFATFFIKRLRIQPEVVLYAAFALWSLTGIFFAVNKTYYFDALEVVLFMACMAFAIAGFVQRQGNLRFIGLPLVITGLTVAVLASSGFAGINFMDYVSASQAHRISAEGVHNNPNAVAGLCLFAFIGVLYYWRSPHGPFSLRKILIVGLALLFLSIIIASASRKNALGFIFFFSSYIWYCYMEKIKKNILYLIVAAIVFFFIIEGISTFLSDTYLGYRMQEFQTVEDIAESNRAGLYRRGLELFKKYPLGGVGLDNFRFHDIRGIYSHSDYIEVLTGTGIPGFIFYMSIYVVLFARLRKIYRQSNDPEVLYNIGFAQAVILTILLQAFGRPLYMNSSVIYLIFSFVGYSVFVERNLRFQRGGQAPHTVNK